MIGLTIDQVLEKIGSLNFYQIRLVLILSYAQWIVIGYQVVLLAFVAAEPPWICVNNSTCTLKGDLKPGVDGYNLRCGLNRSDWKFKDDITSVVTEFDLVCDNAFLASLTTSVIFAGWLVTSLAAGVLSDKFGRKPVMFLFASIAVVFALIGAFAEVYWLFTLCRLLVGVGIGGSAMPIFVLATEFVGVHHRHLAGTALWFFRTFSFMSLAGIAYFIRNWRTLSIVCAVPGFLFLATWRFVPESARYLILKGKLKKTEGVLRTIAKANKKMYPTEPLSNPTAKGQQNLGDIRDLFRTKRMIHRTLVSWYSWAVNSMVYYGESFASPSLGGNMYLNFFLTSIVEIPGNACAMYFMGRFGRKKPLVICLILAALSAIGCVVITMYDPGDNTGYLAGRIIMAMTSKFYITIAYDIIYVHTAELFPTVVRNVGMGTSTAAARVGSFSAPYVVSLNRIHPLLPFGIMAAKAFLAGLLCMTLPETKGKPTEETMDGDAPMAARNVVVMSELEDDEKTAVGKGKEEKDEEKHVENVQPQDHKTILNGDAPMAARNVVVMSEMEDDERTAVEKGKEEKDEEINVEHVQPQDHKPILNGDAPMAADNVVAVDDVDNVAKKKSMEENKKKQEKEQYENAQQIQPQSNNQAIKTGQPKEGAEAGVENTAF